MVPPQASVQLNSVQPNWPGHTCLPRVAKFADSDAQEELALIHPVKHQPVGQHDCDSHQQWMQA
jgi:hypothetical protein